LVIDPLTGLYTRKAFLQRLSAVLEKARPAETPLSLAYFDIDHFLAVNHTLGHASGDAVLRRIADLSRQIAGEQAILGRYGGDEIALLLPGVEREAAFLTLERIRAAVDQETTFGEQGKTFSAHVTISAGIASHPLDGRSEYELIRKADQALYRAKLGSRNTIRLAQEEKMVPKTSHYTQTQLERLSRLAQAQGVGEAELLREAMDDLLIKYGVNEIQFQEIGHALHIYAERSTEGVAIVNQQGIVLTWNPRLEDITGVPAAQALGKKLWELKFDR
jgi:diguanylate cyclase (GGDEF)-like protein